jgi:signal peptidase II
MRQVSKLGWIAFLLAAAVVALDQAAKYWILSVLGLAEGQSAPFLGPIALTHIWNPGVSFGFLQSRHDLARWLLTLFSALVALFLASWVRKTERPLFAVAVGLVMGGAVGNAIDRVRLGQVADFIDATRLYFPWIFNVADSAISIGICLLLIDMLRQDSRERAAKAAVGPGGDAA